ncbi:Cytochrome c551 peroxidase precursor [compost metagenome]
MASDIGKFRVPSLRNIEVTAPYMHDGRLGTLEEVLDHYAEGIKQHFNLDGELQQNGKIGITLSASERSKIIAFLKTLTDNDFLTDPRFQRP